jgi:hypothetical protein
MAVATEHSVDSSCDCVEVEVEKLESEPDELEFELALTLELEPTLKLKSEDALDVASACVTEITLKELPTTRVAAMIAHKKTRIVFFIRLLNIRFFRLFYY